MDVERPESVVMPLSPTERKVLALFDQGKSYKEIGFKLHISVNTVRTHGRRIVVKTMAVCLREAAFRIGGRRIS